MGLAMTEPHGANPLQQYFDAVEELKRLNELQASVKNLETKVAQNRAEKIRTLDLVTIPYLYEQRNNLHLSETYKSYIDTWLKEQVYERKKEFTSKYTEKGNLCEADAIDFVAEQMGWGFVNKNIEHFEDEHFTGTPDIILPKSVDDTKCVWSCFSLPIFDHEMPDAKYEWQGLTYMALVNRMLFGLHYCLMDAPEHMIEAEARKMSFKAGYDELKLDFYEDVKSTMVYSHLPASLRLKSYFFERNLVAISAMRERVELGRKYIDTLKIDDYLTECTPTKQ